MVGRIGIYRIDSKNKIAELGYWIAEDFAGKGIITKSCAALTSYCFKNLSFNSKVNAQRKTSKVKKYLSDQIINSKAFCVRQNFMAMVFMI